MEGQRELHSASLPRGRLGKVWVEAGARDSKELRFQFLGTWHFHLEETGLSVPQPVCSLLYPSSKIASLISC